LSLQICFVTAAKSRIAQRQWPVFFKENFRSFNDPSLRNSPMVIRFPPVFVFLDYQEKKRESREIKKQLYK